MDIMAKSLYVVDGYKGYLTDVDKDYVGFAMCDDMGKLFKTYQKAYNFLKKYERYGGNGRVVRLNEDEFMGYYWYEMNKRAI